jgi:hypothetical protein
MAQFRTCFSSICESGYKIDLVKSGMQKYLRRREVQKMKWCATEIYKFKFGKNENEIKIGKGIISNLLNRIIVMLDEELCFDEVVRYDMVYDLLEKIKNSDDFNEGVKMINNVCDILCDGNLLRLNSDIIGYFNKRIFIDKEEIDVNKMEYDGVVDYKGENEEYEYCMRNFIGCFGEKNTNCYYWLFRIFNMDNEGVKTRYRRKEYIYGVWEYLEKLIGENEMLRKSWNNRINEFYDKNKKERKMFMVGIVNVFMYRDEIDFNKEIVVKDGGVMNNGEKLVFDDYCIDMHCKDGRVAGKDKKDFAIEGCLVINEYLRYKVDDWRDYYINDKLKDNIIVKKVKSKKVKSKKIDSKKVDGKKVESKMVVVNKDKNLDLEFIDMKDMKFVRLCTNSTCGNKVMCFIVEYEGKMYVLKEGRKSMNYNYDYDMIDKCKEIFGLNCIGMKRIRSNKIIEKINKKQNEWVDNWNFVDNENVIYCMMNYIEGEKFIDYRKKNKVSKEMWSEYMKIGLFRGIFMVSDYNQLNVLICNNNLYSIDEHDILGKRVSMIGAKNIKVFNDNKDEINKIFDDLFMDKDLKIEKIREIMTDFNFSLSDIDKVCDNYKNLKDRFLRERFDMEIKPVNI